MPESNYSISDADRCRFVFRSHAKAVVCLDDLSDEEVKAFAELAETGLVLKADAGPRFRALWVEHLDRRKGSDATNEQPIGGGDPDPKTPDPGDA